MSNESCIMMAAASLKNLSNLVKFFILYVILKFASFEQVYK